MKYFVDNCCFFKFIYISLQHVSLKYIVKSMKKLFVIAAMMVAAVSANAQFEPGTLSIQPKLGGTISWLSNTPKMPIEDLNSRTVELDKKPIFGALVGAEAEYQLTNIFSVAAGLNFSMQGSGWKDYDQKIGDVKFDVKDSRLNLYYINLPVVANVYLFKGFAVKAGVQVGFLVKANIEVSSSIKDESTKETVTTKIDRSFTSDCKKVDVAIPMGVSYQVPTIPIVIDARYNLGLTKVNKESEEGYKDVKNNVIQLTVGYKFAL